MTETVLNTRRTPLLVGGLLAGLAAVNALRGGRTGPLVLAVVGLSLVAVAAFAPGAARRFHYAWMKLAGALGYVNTRILLAVVFFVMITGIGVVRRLLGHDPLLRRRRRDSYWVPRPETRQPSTRFEHLF